MAGKKQAPAKQPIEEDDDGEGWEDAVVETDKESAADLRLRDWRDVERYREMKELRRLVDDDYGLEEIFHLPIKPRAEAGAPPPRNDKAGKAVPAGARARNEAARAKPVPATRAAPKKPSPKLKAKAKRR